MGWITDIVAGNVGTFVKDVGDTVKQFVTTDKDRLDLETKLQEMQNGFIVQMGQQTNDYEGQITERLKADMGSDSWLSKNIRPLTLIFILVMYSLLSISSGFEFKVTDAYVTLLGQWGMLIMSFYFGGRTLEKVATTIKGAKG
jgi:hypothetical protein